MQEIISLWPCTKADSEWHVCFVHASCQCYLYSVSQLADSQPATHNGRQCLSSTVNEHVYHHINSSSCCSSSLPHLSNRQLLFSHPHHQYAPASSVGPLYTCHNPTVCISFHLSYTQGCQLIFTIPCLYTEKWLPNGPKMYFKTCS